VPVFHAELEVATGGRTDLLDITGRIVDAMAKCVIKDGICQVFVPHTTAGITINENADPDVKRDIAATLERLLPWRYDYTHIEGNSAAHIKASLMGSSISVPLRGGRLELGTWQGILLCEFDGPRRRRVIITVLGD
jgi:secondary thiamine-phosphate synthase enzyme